MKIAFDIDDTLYKIVPDDNPHRAIREAELTCTCGTEHKAFKQVLDYDLLQVLRWFVNNGDEVYVWSAGGIDYAQHFVDKFGIEGVTVVGKMRTDKEGVGTGMLKMDIAFDDCETRLAKVDVRVNRKRD